MNKIMLSIIIGISIILSSCSYTSINTNPLNDGGDAVIVEDYVHSETDRGEAFNLHYFNASVGNGNNASVLIKTNGAEVHLTRYSVIADLSPDDVTLHEGVVPSNNGSPIDIYNLNRILDTNTTVIATINPVISDYGEIIDRDLILDNKKVGGQTGTLSSHWILKNNTYYLINIENRGGAPEEVLFSLRWYEKPIE